MERALTDPERLRLLQAALGSFPDPIGTCLVLVLARAKAIDDALLAAAAGEHASAWRRLLPAEAADAERLQQLGWQPPVHEPELIASLALNDRRFPLERAIVEGLRSIAATAGPPAGWAVAMANTHLRDLAARLSAAADTAAPHLAEPGEPEALEALCQASGDDGCLQGACKWLVSAIGKRAHRSWPASAIDAALGVFELSVTSRMFRYRVTEDFERKLDASASELLAGASLERALKLFASSARQQVRRAALARVRALSQDVRAEAGRALHDWVFAMSIGPNWSRPTRGPLGIFEPRALGAGKPREVSSDELDWLRAAGAEAVVTAGLRLVSLGHGYSLVRRLLGSEHGAAFERAAIERFESGAGSPDELERFATCLREIGTEPAAGALLRGLASDTHAAHASEQALSVAEPRTLPHLLAASAGADPRLALRATRALAARADEAARGRLEELALGGGVLRWIAILGLGRLGRHSGTCRLLRHMLDGATPPEAQLILDTVARCAAAPEDVAWTLELPVRPGLEEPLLHCAAQLVALSGAGRVNRMPHAWFQRIAELLAVRSHDIWNWTLEYADKHAIARELRRRFPDEARLAWLEEYLAPISEVMAAPAPLRMPSPPPPPAELRLDPAACFSVLAPECVAPSAAFLVEVFVHSKAARDTLAEWSSMRDARRFTVGPRQIAAGATLDVVLSIDGLELEQPSGQVLWDGDLGILLFPCKMPVDALASTYPGKAAFSLQGIPIAEVHFLLSVGPVAGARRELATRERMIRSAFASYATPDRAAVLARIQGIQKVAPFIDIFLDVLSLRSGDRWADVIRNEIRSRDVLLLFWSTAASRSHHVDSEWRIALEEHGLDGISPVPLEGAAVAPPPPELSSLHFNDWTLTMHGGAPQDPHPPTR